MAKRAENKISLTNTSENSVKIAGGKLILSLPDAHMPVVWQMGLDSAQASSFTITEDKKQKVFMLVLKAEGGAVDEIAAFNNKKAATDVLMMASSALQNNTTSALNVSRSSQKDNSGKIGAVLAFLMLVALIAVWMLSAGSNLSNSGGLAGNEQASSVRDSSGVPVSADEFLNSR